MNRKNTILTYLIYSLFIVFLLPENAIGQEKKITIIDSLTKIPVTDALLLSMDGKLLTTSNERGELYLTISKQAQNQFVIQSIGFEIKKVLIEDNLNDLIVYLTNKITNVNEVFVSGKAEGSGLRTVSALDIHLRPINNAQEILRIVPGLFIGQHAGGGKAEQLFLRGFDLDHGTDISLSVDGMPVNMVSHAHGQGYADLHFVIPELIDRVDFDKGPYKVDKGNFTTAGFVAFKTKDFLPSNFIKVEGGQFNSLRAVTGINLLKANNVKRNQSLYFAGEGSYTKGYFDSPQDFNRFNGLLKYHGNIGEKSTLTALVSGFTSEWKASGQIPVRALNQGLIGFYGAIDNTEGGKTSRYNASAELSTNFKNGGVLKNQIYYSNYNFELFSNFTFFKEDSINGDQIRQKENRNIIGSNSVLKYNYNLGNLKTESQFGVQTRYDNVDNLELSRTKNRTTVTQELMNGKVDELNVGVFYSQKIEITNRLDVTPAIRFDYFLNKYDDKLSGQQSIVSSTILSPKLNFNFKANENIQLYLLNGRGFHSNDTRVAVQENGKKVVPPAYGTDLGGIFKIGKNTLLQSAIWYLWLDQEFVYVGDEGVVEAGGQTRRFGWDVSLRYQVLKHLYADVDLNITNPRAIGEPKGQNYLALAPIFTSVGGLVYKKKTGLNGSLRYRYMANRPADETFEVIAKGYFIADAAINYAYKNWEVGVSVQNLFNSKWKETQFLTDSKLQNEQNSTSEIHFTPGTPFFAKLNFTAFF